MKPLGSPAEFGLQKFGALVEAFHLDARVRQDWPLSDISNVFPTRMLDLRGAWG